MIQVTTSSLKSISVLVIDMSHYQEAGSEMFISGFVAREEAIDYARRRVRASLEELRTANQTPEALRRLWAIYGEEVIVVGANYSASSELDHFIAQPATEAEGDWRAIEKRLATQLHKRIAD